MAVDVKTRIMLGSYAANFAGACFIFGYLEFVAPLPPKWHSETVVDAALAMILLLVTAVIQHQLVQRRFRQATAWRSEGRAPTTAEQQATLNLPWRSTEFSVVSWVGGAFAFAAWAWKLHSSALFTAQVLVTILLGGLVSVALAYFLIERAAAPLIPITLRSHAPPLETTAFGLRPRLILAWALGSAIPLLGLALLPLDARASSLNGGPTPSIAGAVIAVSLAGVVVGLIITFAVAGSVADPLDHVREGLRLVKGGDLDVVVNVEDGGEIGLLQSGFNEMVNGLRERAQLRDLFGRHVGVEVAQRALEEGSGLGGEQHTVSALFVDLVGSTALAEVLPPGEVVATLNAFFDTVVRVVSDEGGWVNKFEGDGALCVFGAPGFQPDHCARALRAARRLDGAIRARADDYPGLSAGIGVSSGVVVAGNVGTEKRYEYTVIGRAVNEAARLTEIAKGRPTRVLATGNSLAQAGPEAASWASLGTVAIRGGSQPVAIYEPVEVTAPAATTPPPDHG
ncbi:MAG TPA: adenylate/guanylate cyclase domain-containing protein [Acidimicrobiales bacterium]|jgi:adenylate cyclase|nr:adenylate/guanylate cyclase domain-containing protein [Acidimicrobiales bacterium]